MKVLIREHGGALPDIGDKEPESPGVYVLNDDGKVRLSGGLAVHNGGYGDVWLFASVSVEDQDGGQVAYMPLDVAIEWAECFVKYLKEASL